MMRFMCLCLVIFFIYHHIHGTIIYVTENSTAVLRCPFKTDNGSIIDWYGPPGFEPYTIGKDVNPNLPHSDRISVVVQIDKSEYNLQISNIQQSDQGQYQCAGRVNGQSKTSTVDMYFADTAHKTIIYVTENSTGVLRCPFKTDSGFALDWFGPPGFEPYTIGRDVNPNLPHNDRISVVGQIDEREYNLQISSIQQSDQGQYQCAGHVNGYSKTSEVDMYFAVPPVSRPLLSRNPTGLIFVGNTILLKCEVIGGTPLAKISWQCDGFFGEHNTSTYTKVESTVNLTLKERDNQKKCTCIVNHPSWTSPESMDIFLNVFFAPDTNLTLQRKPVEGIISGTKVNLTCIASGGNPLATLSWNCSGTNTNYTTEQTVSYSVEFEVDKNDNNKLCTCSATHPITTYRSQVQTMLIVYYEPGTNPFISQNPSGGILTGKSVKLTCTVPGGNPLAILSWNCNGTRENNTAGYTASYSITLHVDKRFNNRICTCTARHLISTYIPTVQQNIVVYYAPDERPSIHQTPHGSVFTSSIVILTCSVKGGNPLAVLKWNCTGDTTNSTTDTTSTYSVSFPVNKTQNKATCTCSASHTDTSYAPVIDHILDVYFAPDTNLTIQRNPAGGIISGNKVNLTCTASGGNPLATLSWNCSGTNTYYTTGNTTSHTVEFTVDKSDNNKICTCSATHPVTSYRSTVENRLLVYFKPFLDTTKSNSPVSIDVSENHYLFITVVVKSNPHPIINWTFIQQENIYCYNYSVINSTSINVGLRSSSNISIDNLKKNQFGQYTFMATNAVGIFRRKFSVFGKAEDMEALREDNSGMFGAGIASLIIGILFFVAVTIFLFRKRFKKTFTKPSKSDEYSDIQTCNSAFQDPYTSIHNPIESRNYKESSDNTYEECGNAFDAVAYQNVENMKSGQNKAEKNIGIYDNMKI